MARTLSAVTADDLQGWMSKHGYSVRTLAAATERASTTIQRYRDGTLAIPRVFELALRGLEADRGGPDEDRD